MQDWPIVIFTLFVQTSIGASIFFSYLFMTKKLNGAQYSQDVNPLFKPFIVTTGLAVAGLLASFGHLGYPLNAPNAIRHVFSSWLSREIILTSAYIGLSTLVVLAIYCKRYTQYIPYILPVIIAVGLLDIYSMASMYKASSVVTWLSNHTYIQFYGTALFLGGSIVLCWLKALLLENNQLHIFAQRIIIIMLLYGLFQLIFLPFYIVFIQAHPYNEVVTFPIDSVKEYFENMHLQAYRYIALALGLGAMTWGVFKKQLSYLHIAFGVLIVAEVLGRYIFYNIHP